MTMINPQVKVSETPILISGAGPVGLLAAIILTRLGISCRLIERELHVSPMSKALAIHARSLEIMEQLSLIDQFLANGHPISQLDFYFNGVHSIFPGLSISESHYNYALFLEQAKTVKIFTQELERRGNKVDRGWELLDTKIIEEDGKTWVETTIRRALDGNNIRATESKVVGLVDLDDEQAGKEYEIEVVRSEYLIAADGGKSVVRHKLNIPFLGRTLENNVILFDGEVEADFDLKNITVISGRNNKTMNIFPLSDGQYRIMVDGSHLDPRQELTNEVFEKVIQSVAAPNKIYVKRSSWLTFYKVNERQASSYSFKNRVFIAGDAAHSHSPAGGQGMNMGLQDVFNLTWKLALVLNGLCDTKILDTYGSERIPVARSIIDMSASMFATGFSNQLGRRIARKLIITLASVVLRYVQVPSERVSMLSIKYHENMINQLHKTQPKPKEGDEVGQRAHDGPLAMILPGGKVYDETIRLHQLMLGLGAFQVLVFTADMLSVNAGPVTHGSNRQGIVLTDELQLKKNIDHYTHEWRTKWEYRSQPLQDGKKQSLFNVHVIGALPERISGPTFHDYTKIQADSLAMNDDGKGKLYFDLTSLVHQRYGVPIKGGSGAIVVIRPDSHIGYRVLGAADPAWQDVHQYFLSIFNVSK